jgi:anti-sigma B factor antagonist
MLCRVLMSQLLTIGRCVDGDSVALNLHGDIDLYSAPLLDDALRDAERSHPVRIVIDCSELDFIDSSGLSVLIEAQRRADERGHALVLSRVPDHAVRILAITGLSARFMFA